ncbi:unnamed protein product [Amoebophrya sp. A25]|nr:unnamed protein product [Amoebophrya sp. A25]|eukprot:GSA25T00000402001.1
MVACCGKAPREALIEAKPLEKPLEGTEASHTGAVSKPPGAVKQKVKAPVVTAATPAHKPVTESSEAPAAVAQPTPAIVDAKALVEESRLEPEEEHLTPVLASGVGVGDNELIVSHGPMFSPVAAPLELVTPLEQAEETSPFFALSGVHLTGLLSNLRAHLPTVNLPAPRPVRLELKPVALPALATPMVMTPSADDGPRLVSADGNWTPAVLHGPPMTPRATSSAFLPPLRQISIPGLDTSRSYIGSVTQKSLGYVAGKASAVRHGVGNVIIRTTTSHSIGGVSVTQSNVASPATAVPVAQQTTTKEIVAAGGVDAAEMWTEPVEEEAAATAAEEEKDTSAPAPLATEDAKPEPVVEESGEAVEATEAVVEVAEAVVEEAEAVVEGEAEPAVAEGTEEAVETTETVVDAAGAEVVDAAEVVEEADQQEEEVADKNVEVTVSVENVELLDQIAAEMSTLTEEPAVATTESVVVEPEAA